MAAGLLVLALALLFSFRGFVDGDASDVTHFVLHPSRAEQGTGSFAARIDTRFVVWLVSRNGRTWSESPPSLFDGEICHPTPQSIALGEPGLTLGLVGMPAWLATQDPIWTFNFVSVVIIALGALAMFALVRAWTGSVTAAVVAGLAYGFHPLKLSDPIHLYVPDTAWTVFALFFFVRWLERGRWRDVLGLAAATCLQIGGSLYPLIGAAALGLPVACWGALRIGIDRTRPAQWIALLTVVATCVALVFAPFLDKAATGDLATRPAQIYLTWAQLFGLGYDALGWGLLALAGLAFLPTLPTRTQTPTPNTKGLPFALLVGLALCLALATGGNEIARLHAQALGAAPPPALPNLFRALAMVLPGLDVVRLPAAIGHGTYLALAILAGLGVAAVLARVPPRLRPIADVALVVLVFVYVLRPGLPGAAPLATWSQRPAETELAFFDALEAAGNTGPVLALPNPQRPHPRYGRSILLSAYHHRPTSGCYNSFLPAETLEAETVARALPEPDAIARAAEMGFTTLLLYEDARGFDTAELATGLSALEGRGLTRLHSDGRMSAWSIDASKATRSTH